MTMLMHSLIALMAGGSGESTFAWDSATATALITLTNSDRTAEADTSNFESVRGAKNDLNTANGGKFYWEVLIDTLANTSDIWLGVKRVADSAETSGNSPFPGSLGFALLRGSGSTNTAGAWTTPGTPGSYAASDVVMIALDCDTGQMWFGENGTWYDSGDPAGGTNPIFEDMPVTTDYCPFFSTDNTAGAVQVTLRATAAHLAHTIPSGFTALDGTT